MKICGVLGTLYNQRIKGRHKIYIKNIHKKILLLSFHVFLLSSRIIKTNIIDSVYFSCSSCILLPLSNTWTPFFNTASVRRYNQDMNRFTQYGIPLRDRERGEHVRACMCRTIRDATHTQHTCSPRFAVPRHRDTQDLFASHLVTALPSAFFPAFRLCIIVAYEPYISLNR